MAKWLGFAALATVGVIASYFLAYPSATIRYRLTFEAEVDGQLKTGLSVSEVTYGEQSQFAAQSPLRIYAEGEAVVLDIGPNQKVFALRTAERDDAKPEWIVPFAFGLSGRLTNPVGEGIRRLRSLSGSRELPFDNLPLLVRFRDINDPRSVERVDPQNLAKSFGPNVRLKRVVIEVVPRGLWPFRSIGISGVPLTNTITSAVLPWLPYYYDKKFDGSHVEYLDSRATLSNFLGSGAFKTR